MSTEIAARFSRAEAEEFTEELKADYGSLRAKIASAWKGRIWLALDYESWQEYLDGEFHDISLRPPKELEEQVIGELRSAGMSVRGIASATEISRSTIDRRIGAAGVPDGTPADSAPVIGLDGKEYSREQPPRSTAGTHPKSEHIVDAEVVEDEETDDFITSSGLEPTPINLNQTATTPGREHVVRAIRELHYGASAPLPMVKKQSKLLEVAFSGGVSDLGTLEEDKVEDLARDVADALGVLSDLLSAMATQPAASFQNALSDGDTVGSVKKAVTNLQVISRR